MSDLSVAEWVMAGMVIVVYGAVIVWLLRMVVRNIGEMRRDGWPKGSDFVEVAKAMRDLPSLLGDRMDHWLMGQHQPAWTGEPQPAPCRHCHKKEWPCEVYMEAANRYADRGQASVKARRS